MTPKLNTDAQGQMRGYLFQIERALFWLSNCEPGSFIGVETGDDVVIKDSNDAIAYEQDKSSISQKLPFSDSSEDLWKTLCIWLRALNSENGEKISSLFLVSNKKVPSSRFIWKMHYATSNSELTECLNCLKTISSNSNKIRTYISEVKSYSDEQLVELIRKISVSDSNTSRIDEIQIRDNLKISKDIPFNTILLTLKGWVFESVVQAWDNGEPAWIEVDSLVRLSNNLVAEYINRPFIEKAISHIPISKKDIDANKDQKFVYQLEIINADEDDKLDAINDFLRSSAERTRCAKAGQITKEDFELFEHNLIDRWKAIFKPKIRSNDVDKENLGYDIYYETVDHREKLKGVETEQNYTTKGAYHRLSNDLKIGWHPEWKHLIQK